MNPIIHKKAATKHPQSSHKAAVMNNRSEIKEQMDTLKKINGRLLKKLAINRDEITPEYVESLIWKDLSPYMCGPEDIKSLVVDIVYLLIKAKVIPDNVFNGLMKSNNVSTFSRGTVNMMEMLLFMISIKCPGQQFDTRKVVSAIWTRSYRRMMLAYNEEDRDEYRNIAKDLTRLLARCSITYDLHYIEPQQDGPTWFPMIPIPEEKLFGTTIYNMWLEEVQALRNQPLCHIPQAVLENEFK